MVVALLQAGSAYLAAYYTVSIGQWIAHDLRREVLDLMNQGKSDEEIKRFLVDRYGEFVLYKPDVAGSTWLLWFGPAVLLLAGAATVFRIVRKRGVGTVASDDNQEW